MRYIKKSSFLILVFVCLISSLSAKEKPFRYYLSDYVEYQETPAEYSIENIKNHKNDFKPLDKAQFKKINNLIRKDGDYLWLRIRFYLPNELKKQNLGVFIAQLNASDNFYINGTLLRRYGSFPPNQISAGFASQFFMIPEILLNQDGINEILIQVYPGSIVSLSDYFFIGNQSDVLKLADIKTFFNSRILLIYASVMFILFIIFFFLFVILRKYKESVQFMSFSMLLFYSIHFLVPFFITEIPWIKPAFISYFTIIKFFFGVGTFTTIYFANSFIIHYIGIRDSKKIVITRLILWAVPTITVLFFTNINTLVRAAPFFTAFILTQFFFSLPRLFKSFFDKSKRKDSITLLLGFAPVDIGVIVDIIIKLILKIDHLPYFTIYGWLITATIFLIYLLIRFGKMYINNIELKEQLSSFNTHLEDVVAIRTKEVTEANFILSRGLETVSHVQKNFLPPKSKTLKGWEIAVSYKALDHEVSGDLYDYYYNKSTLYGLGLFDVSGHGIPAGLMTILAKGIISQHFLAGIAEQESTSDILKEINKSYIKEKVNVENYITGLLFHFSEFNKNDVCSLEVANAGHPYPFIYSKQEDKIVELKYQNSDEQYGIIGIEDLEVSFPPVSCRLAVDDILVCYTDGITESINQKGEYFGKERLMNIVKDNKDYSAEEIKDKVMAKFTSFMEKAPVTDDISLIILKRTASEDFIEEI